MFNNNGFGRAISAALGALLLLFVTGGLVSCGFGGGESDDDTEQQQNEDNEDNEDKEDDD